MELGAGVVSRRIATGARGLAARARHLAAGLRRRFNPRLHPLAAVGIGLGVAALLLPDPAADLEAHSEAEILERLTAPGIDLQHGPGFWLEEKRRGSRLYAEALARCRRGANTLRPNCRLLLTLDRAGRSGPPPVPARMRPPMTPPMALPGSSPVPPGEPSTPTAGGHPAAEGASE